MQIERENIELEKREAPMKWELEKARTIGETELGNKRLQLV